jgi:TldD protein
MDRMPSGSASASATLQEPAVITREPTIERLAIAEGLLLAPFGLTEANLAATLAAMGEHRVDDADL